MDPSATRATKDLDLLVRRSHTADVARVMESLGFTRLNMRDLVLFIDPEEPSKRAGVHLVWSGEWIRPSYPIAAPTVDEAVRDPEGFLVLDLPALVRMKLTSFRDIDRVHIADMLAVGLIDDRVRLRLPRDLLDRLADVERAAAAE